MVKQKLWIVVAMSGIAIPVAAVGQDDSSPPETAAMVDCIVRQAGTLSWAPDAASEVASAVITACEKDRRALITKLEAVSATPAQIEALEDYLRRSAQHWVVYERAARARLAD